MNREKLDFDYCNRSNESIAYIGDMYRVRMIQDCDAMNPFTEWDSYWPMIVDYHDRGHNFTLYDKAPGPDVNRPLDRFTPGQIIRHQRKILAALGDEWSLERDFADHMGNIYPGDDRAEYMRDYFADCLESVADRNKLETMAALYQLIGIESLCTSSHGYCQGDYAELLIVATPEAMDQFGWKRKDRTAARIAADMESQANLYGQWAWGDCYGFVLERAPDDPDDRDDSDAWEDIDSCWGFYGSDPEENGMADHIWPSVESDMRKREQFAATVAASAAWGMVS